METKKTPPPIPPKKAGFVPAPAESVYEPEVGRPKFVKGNQLWQMVKNPGRRALTSDPAELWQKAVDYFNWADANPLYKEEPVKHQGEGTTMELSLGRPYSMDAFTIFAGVSGSYFRTRKLELADKEDMKTATPQELDLLETILLIEATVRTQRFDGAAVNIFNSNLISRVDGYADNVNQHNSGEVRQNIVVRDQKTADDLKKLDDMLK